MRRKFCFAGIFQIVLLILGVGLVPINLYLLFMSEWITFVFAVLLVLTLGLYYRGGRGKSASKIMLTMLTVLTVVFLLFSSYCSPYWNSLLFKKYGYSAAYTHTLSFKQAKSDIDFVMKYIKKNHPIFRTGIPNEIQQAYEQTLESLKHSEEITVLELHRKLQNILSLLKDGHTSVFGKYENAEYLKHTYWRDQNDHRLIAVNDITIADLFQQKSNLFSYEVESYGIESLRKTLTRLEDIFLLGFDLSKGISYTYQSPTGETDTVTYTKEDFISYDEYLSYQKTTEDTPKAFVSYTVDENKSLALLTLTSCKYNQEYRDCLKDLFTEIKQKEIQRVAVDLRANRGGSAAVANEFIRYLNVDTYKTGTYKWRFGIFNIPSGNGIVKNKIVSDLVFDGDVYILTSTLSFSSAMLFAEYIKDNQLGTIVGEAPGNDPSGYGEITAFKLPNSRLFFQVSTKQFFRANTETEDILILPDIECLSDKAVDVLFEIISREEVQSAS